LIEHHYAYAESALDRAVQDSPADYNYNNENHRFLYSFGVLRLNDEGEMERTKGIVHTIKDGIVINNARLMEEVERMVAASKEGIGPSAILAPFKSGNGG